jgi:hypothetical protein
LLKLIKRYYRFIDRELHADSALDLSALKPPLALIPIVAWSRLTEKAVRYGLMIAPEVIAIHLTRLEGPDAEEHNGRLRRQWRQFVEMPAQKAGLPAPKLLLSPSPYRSFVGHLLRRIGEVRAQSGGRPIVVVIPELIKEHWWDYLLVSRRAHRLREALVRHGGPDLAVAIVPWAREPPHPEKIIEQEEPVAQAPAAGGRTATPNHQSAKA